MPPEAPEAPDRRRMRLLGRREAAIQRRRSPNLLLVVGPTPAAIRLRAAGVKPNSEANLSMSAAASAAIRTSGLPAAGLRCPLTSSPHHRVVRGHPVERFEGRFPTRKTRAIAGQRHDVPLGEQSEEMKARSNAEPFFSGVAGQKFRRIGAKAAAAVQTRA